MKVDPRTLATQPSTAPRAQPFKQLLTEARGELKKQPQVSPTAAKSALTTATPNRAKSTAFTDVPTGKIPVAVVKAQQTLSSATASSQTVAANRQTARAHADSEAHRLGDVRSGHARIAESLTDVRAQHSDASIDRTSERLIGFITKELTQDPGPAKNDSNQQPVELKAVSSSTGDSAPPKVESTPETKTEQTVALIEKIETFVRSNRPGLALTLNNSLGAQVEISRVGPKEIALKLTGHGGPPSAEAVSRIREELRARGLKVSALEIA